MIAEEKNRRKGFATESLLILIDYITKEKKITKFIAKIKENNIASITLFTKLGFYQTKKVNIFGEIEMELNWNQQNNSCKNLLSSIIYAKMNYN